MKRYLLPLFLFITGLAHAQSATPLSSCSAGTTSVSQIGCTLTYTPHTVLVVGAFNYGGPTATPVSDTASLTWNELPGGCEHFFGGSRNTFLTGFWADTGTVSGSQTVTTFNIASDTVGILVGDFQTGNNNPTPDANLKCNDSASGSPGTINSLTATLSQPNELVVGVGLTNGAGLSAGTGYTMWQTTSGTIGLESTIVPSSGTYSVPFQQSGSLPWMVLGVSFDVVPNSKRRHVTIY